MGITTICACCGDTFQARSVLAVYCSVNCKARASYYRRQGRPIPATKQIIQRPQPIRPQVLQPCLVEDDDDPNDLPAVWRLPPAGTEERIWQGTAIQRREADGFVNATAMCKAGGKRWNHYITLDRTQEYMAALASVVPEKPCGAAVAGIPATGFALIHTIQGGTPALQGTWIHPRLAIDLARWISPAFAVWMDGWFLESFTPALQPARQRLDPGVHVVAASERGAAMIWHEVITAEVTAALARLNPAWRSETCLPLSHHYTFTPAT
jgi:hypothetical protein